MISHDGVQILENQVTRCLSSCKVENFVDAVLGTRPTRKRLDIQCRDLRRAIVERVHHGLDTDGLAITWRAVVYYASLPWNLQSFVCVLTVEKSLYIADDRFLHAVLEDHVVPASLLDAFE